MSDRNILPMLNKSKSTYNRCMYDYAEWELENDISYYQMLHIDYSIPYFPIIFIKYV